MTSDFMCKYNNNKFSKALTLTLVALMFASFSYAQKPLKGFREMKISRHFTSTVFIVEDSKLLLLYHSQEVS